ncbi:hypothetical protein AcV5_009062 [Taiwanofungus camphoratus]|nr:hypothetical protein AcV5_009062 [Antrodia cinnamomea]
MYLSGPSSRRCPTNIMSLESHRLTSTSSNLSEILPRVLSLSNKIFSAEQGSKYASVFVWQERLSSPSSVVLYLSPRSRPDTPVAFLFAHTRTRCIALREGETESLHIWLAGVLQEWRKEGHISRMVGMLESVSLLTVCTTPREFLAVWNWLTKRRRPVERELEDGKVMLARSGWTLLIISAAEVIC